MASAITGPLAAAEVRVALHYEGPPDPPKERPVEVFARADGEDLVEPVPGKVPGSVVLHLKPGKLWTLGALGEGLWSGSPVVFVPPEGTEATLRLWPTGRVVGALQAAKGEEVPSSLWIRIRPEARREAKGEYDGPAGSVECPVQEERFACDLPAGRHDVRLASRPFVAHYRFGLEVAPERETTVGTLALVRGGSLVGWVEHEGDGSGKPASVRLVPQSAVPPIGPAGERMAQLTMHEEVSEKGFFQFEGVSPGHYDVIAEQEGFAPARALGVAVMRDQEAELPAPLVLEPVRPVDVVLDPPVDPWGKPWSVSVEDLNSVPRTLEELARDAASEEGRVSFALGRGSYLLRVETRQGDGWHEAPFEVSGEAVTLAVALQVVRVAGTVRLGGEPLEARVVFGGRYHAESVVLGSDGETGEYRGVLPRAGAWSVEILAVEPPVERSFRDVLVEDNGGDGVAEIDFELPATWLAGEVVDERGSPIDRFSIEVASLEEAGETVRRMVESPEGQFEIFGLPEGQAQVRAEAREGTSNRADVSLSEKVDPPFLRLVIQEVQEIQGRVVDAQGRGVPGAAVFLRGLRSLASFVPRTRTEADGTFAARVPRDETVVMVTVQAPGFALEMFRSPVSEKEQLVVSLDRRGGAMEVRFLDADDLAERELPGQGLFLLHRGAYLGFGALQSWRGVAGGGAAEPSRERIPSLEPGLYHLCRLSLADLASALSGQMAEDCVGGAITEGGVWQVEAPPPLKAVPPEVSFP
ncbi:MAG: carboxypeptidase-like regulatory domain-containing protein [Acidobacteriota bacterium]